MLKSSPYRDFNHTFLPHSVVFVYGFTASSCRCSGIHLSGHHIAHSAEKRSVGDDVTPYVDDLITHGGVLMPQLTITSSSTDRLFVLVSSLRYLVSLRQGNTVRPYKNMMFGDKKAPQSQKFSPIKWLHSAVFCGMMVWSQPHESNGVSIFSGFRTLFI